jgi:hypothetical protein
MKNPFVFIVGCPRSGTTLFRRMVDAHPEVAVIPEVGWLARRYENRVGLTPDGRLTPEFVDKLPKKGGFGRYTPLPVDRDELREFAAGEPAPTYAEFVSLLFDRYGEERGKPLVGNKTVDHALNVGALHEVFPEAKFVHLIRDGRDVAASALSWRRSKRLAEEFSTWDEEPITTAALWWEWHVRRGREAGLPLGGDLYYEIFYEALVADPATESERLCDFLGIPYDDAMVRFHEGREKDDPNLDAKSAWKPPTRGLRDWRTGMDGEDLARFEAVAGDLLDELGYERGTNGTPDGTLNRAEEMRRRFEGRPLPERWGAVGVSGR